MMKNVCRFTLIVMMISTLFIYPMEVNAADNRTILTLQAELADLKKEKQAQANANAMTQKEINEYNSLSYIAFQEKTEAEAQVEAAKLKIIETEEEILSTTEQTNELMRFMQTLQNDQALMQYVSGATSMTDLVMRSAAVEQLTDYYKSTLKNLENLIIENQDLQVELEKKQVELDGKISEYAGFLSKLKVQKSAGNDVMSDINEEIKALEESIKFYKSVCTSDTQPLSECTSFINATGWNKPLIKGVTTSLFGWRKNPLTGATYSTHYGTDIGGNPEGTKVYAAAAGRVSGVIHRSSCGGNRVYVNHMVNGVAYTTEYAHLLNYNVKVGDVVTAATVIGGVGGGSQTKSWDKCSTGAHLHFNVASGHYLGADKKYSYSSYSTFQARSVAPGFIPGKGVWWYSR